MSDRKQLYGEDFIADEIFTADYHMHIIKATDERLDWNKIKFDRLDWDLEVRGLPWQVVRAYYHVHGINDKKIYSPGFPLCHCLGGQYNENNYYAYPLFKERSDEDIDNNQYWPDDPGPTRHNLIEFSGSAPHWGIVAEGSNYIRKGEIRKGARVYITRNNKKFYEIMSGSVSYGMSKAQYILAQLQEHPCNFFSRKWKDELEGRKVWYDNIPAIAYHVMEDQGCIMLKPDPKIGIGFNPDPYMVDNGEVMLAHYDEKDEVKVDYLYHKVNWFRSDQDTKAFIELKKQRKECMVRSFKSIV
jgi:hypothetical protein